VTKPIIAPKFCQVAWVVKDIVAAEKFFVETMGITRFMHKATGVMTELVGSTKDGHDLRRSLKENAF
jgi:hypothetical protein